MSPTFIEGYGAKPDDKARERNKYIAMWELESYRSASPGEYLVDYAIEKLIKPGSVIDFGCGTGRAMRKFGIGYNVLGIDFAPNCLDADVNVPFLVADLTNLPTLRADYGYCCDVMEHIPTDYVSCVLAGIARRVKAAFFSIALHKDSAGRLIGETLHMTVESAAWWEEKLKQHFTQVECEDRGYQLIGICRR